MLLGLILAAGQGKRYGVPKVTAQSGVWLQNAITALHGGGCDAVRVLLGAAWVKVPAPAVPLFVSDYQQGLSRTLLTGIQFAQYCGADAVVIVPVDMPDITAEVIRRLLDEVIQSNCSTKDITGKYSRMLARAVCDNQPRHPVLIGSAYFAELIIFLNQTRGENRDEGARGFLQQKFRRSQVLLVECGDLMTGKDCDYPEDYPESVE